MKYDDHTHTLSFSSTGEVSAFHAEITELLRLTMASAHGDVSDAEQATALSKELMQRYHTVMRALNTLRRSLPRSAS